MKNKIILLMLLSIITAFSYQESYEVLAHFDEIDVTYDVCDPENYVDENNIGDGIHEKWYRIIPSDISEDTYTSHIEYVAGATPKIEYYYAQNAENDNSYNWNCAFTNNDELNFKNDFSNSMRKWNNIYIYFEENQLTSKHKLIDVCEGTEGNHNLIIYPVQNVTYAAATYDVGEGNLIFEQPYDHFHYEKRKIHVNISHFIGLGQIQKSTLIEHTGAHELGHVLGLDDLEECNQSQTYHHEEAIMGYSNNAYGYSLCKNISYKDIAGAMITMGFHTANDHKWMYSPTDYGGYKLICSICNGVKYAPSYPSGSVEFEYCKNLDTDISDHSLSSGNMMPVASYDNYDENGDEYDYYKCKYCRYVAPFTSLVKQNYLRTKIDDNTHKVENIVDSDNDGETDYSIDWFNENHYSNYETNTFVPYPITHAQYALKHKVICGCNEIQTYRAHGFTVSDIGDGGAYNTCIDCNVLIPANTGPGIVGPLSNDIWQVTENGSYKLTNGIIILVEEDIDAYKKGTLVFKDSNSEIM